MVGDVPADVLFVEVQRVELSWRFVGDGGVGGWWSLSAA